MTWVKICGITNVEDAHEVVEAGADALGFVFYDKSPRAVRPDVVRDIIAGLPAHIEKVGVFVDTPFTEIMDTVRQVQLTCIQISALQPLDFDQLATVKQANSELKIISVYSGSEILDGGFFVSERARNLLYALMFDSTTADRPGGTGQHFDWEKASGMVQAVSLRVPVIVAGGLNPANVAKAVRRFQPYGVDVSSGVEVKPGKKDPAKVHSFIQAVREADKTA